MSATAHTPIRAPRTPKPPRPKRPLYLRPSFRYLLPLATLYTPYILHLLHSPLYNPDFPLWLTVLSYTPFSFLLGLSAGFVYYVPKRRADVQNKKERKVALAQDKHDDDNEYKELKNGTEGGIKTAGVVAFPARVARFFPPIRVRAPLPLTRHSPRRHEPRSTAIPLDIGAETEVLFDAEAEINSASASTGTRPRFPIIDRSAALETVEALREAACVTDQNFEVLDVKEALERETRRRQVYLASGVMKQKAHGVSGCDSDVNGSRMREECGEFV